MCLTIFQVSWAEGSFSLACGRAVRLSGAGSSASHQAPWEAIVSVLRSLEVSQILPKFRPVLVTGTCTEELGKCSSSRSVVNSRNVRSL